MLAVIDGLSVLTIVLRCTGLFVITSRQCVTIPQNDGALGGRDGMSI